MPHNYGPEFRARQDALRQLIDQIAIDPSLRVDGIEIQPFSPHFRTNNFVQNTLSRLFARNVSGEKWRWLTVDANDRLLVSTIAGSFENNDTKTGTAADTYGTNIAFDQVATRMDIWIFDNAAMIKRSKDGASFDDEFEVPAGVFYSLDATVHTFNIKNKSAGSNARYSIIGWW